MREHPIAPVTELFQYRAIGLVRGKYIPEDMEVFSKGFIQDENGLEIEAVVLGRTLSLIKRKVSVDFPHLWVVYPRCRESDHLHLQIAGIWEPSTLGKSNNSEEESKQNLKSDVIPISDKVEEGDDYFSIRGELIYTRPESNDIIIKIKQKPQKNRSKSFPFKLYLKGEIPINQLRNFVNLDVRRIGKDLHIEKVEIIGSIKKNKKHD